MKKYGSSFLILYDFFGLQGFLVKFKFRVFKAVLLGEGYIHDPSPVQ